MTWHYDPIQNIWKIKENNEFGVATELKDGFYLVYTKISDERKENELVNFVNDTYYFDKEGKMATGWMQTSDGKWFFFETEKNINEGKMSLGWKYVDYEWYYFTEDGSLFVSAITPDGYPVGVDGKLIR